MKFLLLGRNGQVGWELARALAPLGEVETLDRAAAPLDELQRLDTAIRGRAWDVIVNAAAYTAVDRAEQEADLAMRVNGDAPGVMAREANRRGALMVHYGTDYVFDGSGDRPWPEDALTAPLSVYGQTKLAGEESVRAAGCRHLILRTSWVYAARGGNFAKTMLRLASERDTLSVVADQVGAPTGAELIADATAHAVARVHAEAAEGGTFHLAAAGETSWHGYAEHVLAHAKRAGRTLKANEVRPIRTADFPTLARRPANSRLDTRRFREAFGLHLPPWQAGVERMLDEILGSSPAMPASTP